MNSLQRVISICKAAVNSRPKSDTDNYNTSILAYASSKYSSSSTTSTSLSSSTYSEFDLFSSSPLAIQYRIENRIASGGFGIVYKGRTKCPPCLNDTTVAIKTLNRYRLEVDKLSGTSRKLDNAENIKLETSILKHLSKEPYTGTHQHVLRLYDCFKEEHAYHIVTEYLEGIDLFEKLRERIETNVGPYNELSTRDLMIQIFWALKHCHERNIVHRDLKLENLVFRSNASDESDVVLIDFGLASCISDEDPMLYDDCGTSAYKAPEMLNVSRPGYSKPCDMWSAGLLMFILFRGRPFYQKVSNPPTDDEIRSIQGRYNIPSIIDDLHLSEEGGNLLCRLLQKNPKLRITAHEALEHPWFHREIVGANTLEEENNNEIAARTRRRWNRIRSAIRVAATIRNIYA